MTSNHEALVDLGAWRRRINAGHDYRVAHYDDRRRFDAGSERWHRLLGGYLDAVKRVIEQFDRADLAAARDELADRLARGLALVGEDGETEELMGQFEALLARYEAVCDCLAGYQEATRRMARYDTYAMGVARLVGAYRAGREMARPGR